MSFQLKINLLTKLPVLGSGGGSDLSNLFSLSTINTQEGEGGGVKGEAFDFCLHPQVFPRQE